MDNDHKKPVQTLPTQQDQYRMLREEIMQNVRTLDAVQYVSLLGSAAAYAWLITHKAEVNSKILWYMPPTLLLYCAAKSWDLNKRIRDIGAYLARIEELAFKDETDAPGWERHKIRQGLTFYDRVAKAATEIAWLGAIFLTFFLSWYVSN
jgi:hypothetical protein